MSIATTVRRALGREVEPEEPRPVNLRAEYRDAVLAFIAAKRGNGSPLMAINQLNLVRQRAIADGHGEPMARAWVEPEINGDAKWTDWYARKVEHLLHGSPNPGDRPAQRHEPAFWVPQYRAAAAELIAAYRSRDFHATQVAEGNFWRIRQTAIGAGHGLFVEAHFLGTPYVTTDEASLQAWKEKVDYRLAHGAPSGRYHPPARPLPFVRVSDVTAADEARHSAVVLLAEHAGMPVGTWTRLDPATSWDLVEHGRAQWCRDRPLPEDTRAPVEVMPGDDWPEVRFLAPVRLTTRHRVGEGDIRKVAPDEAEALIRTGAAELFVPPPPPPPRLVTVFE